MGATRRYDAFISYSHGADVELAPRLQRGLQQFARPWYRRRALHVFRDESGLSTSPELWTSIERALLDSRFLVVLLSPDAAGSDWVGREIQTWLAHRSIEEVLPVLTGGGCDWDDGAGDFSARATAVPEALRGRFEEEPRILDLRWAEHGRGAATLDLRTPDFRSAVADLAATIHGIPKDDLESEEVRLHRRAVRLAGSGVAALVVLLVAALVAAVVAVGNGRRAEAGRVEAQSKQLAAESSAAAPAQPDLAGLLAAEAMAVDETPEARRALVEVLQRAPRLERVLHAPDDDGSLLGLEDPDFSPDGSTVIAVGHTTLKQPDVMRWDPLIDYDVVTFDLETGAAERSDVGFGPAEYGADGHLISADADLAVLARDGRTGRWRPTFHAEGVEPIIAPDGATVLSVPHPVGSATGEETTASLVDVTSGDVLASSTLDPEAVISETMAQFDPTGRWALLPDWGPPPHEPPLDSGELYVPVGVAGAGLTAADEGQPTFLPEEQLRGQVVDVESGDAVGAPVPAVIPDRFGGAFLPDGSVLAVSDRGLERLRPPYEQGTLLLPHLDRGVSDVRASADGSVLVVATDATTHLIDLANDRVRWSRPISGVNPSLIGGKVELLVAADGSTVVEAGPATAVRDGATGDIITVSGVAGAGREAVPSPDGRWAVLPAADEGRASVWKDGAQFVGWGPVGVGAIAWSPDSRWLVIGGEDEARLWDLTDLDVLDDSGQAFAAASESLGVDGLSSFAFAPESDRVVATGPGPADLSIFSLLEPGPLGAQPVVSAASDEDDGETPTGVVGPGASPKFTVAGVEVRARTGSRGVVAVPDDLSFDGRAWPVGTDVLVAAVSDGTVDDDGVERWTLAVIDPGRERVTTEATVCGSKRPDRVTSTASGRVVAQAPDGTLRRCVPRGDRFATEASMRLRRPAPKAAYADLGIAADAVGRVVAVERRPGAVDVVDLDRGERLGSMDSHRDPVTRGIDPGATRLAVSADGDTVAGSADAAGTISIYDVGKERAWRFEFPDVIAGPLALSSDGTRLAVPVWREGEGTTIEVFELDLDDRQARPLWSPSHNGGDISTMSFADDDRWLVVGSEDATAPVARYSMDPHRWQDEACARAGRRLTRAEWTSVFGDRRYDPTC